MTTRTRCGWANTALSIPYHDKEWGVPVHDDLVLFEFITLEGAQAGLSWETILKCAPPIARRSPTSSRPRSRASRRRGLERLMGDAFDQGLIPQRVPVVFAA